ncbi:hypothetical protein MYAM1_000568 [Malassezia yamatoensis]|uniref:Uncharacterized protein n=1 Tax=Malassezia yamatoensis TaxID=253288 RepID=A0AAJ5YNZ3_9BASI|nr:hypothetical protein MYAM1_000568 [Malassezia yamatoensis]
MFCPKPLFAIVAAALAVTGVSAKPTFSINDLPNTWEDGQVGTNRCSKYGASNSNSMCQNVFINSVKDFCLFAPYQGQHSVGAWEEKMVSYCVKSGYGTRLIPDGTLKSAYFIKTNSFVQVTGQGDFTSMHIKSADDGGELDPHGATGEGNPPGGLVFTRSKTGSEGSWVQLKEWNNFMSATEFSIRGCWGSNAASYCPHIYDEMGSYFNEPGNYRKGSFEDCDAEPGHFPGVFHGSTFYQGNGHTPDAHKPGASSNCKSFSSVSNGRAVQPLYS